MFRQLAKRIQGESQTISGQVAAERVLTMHPARAATAMEEIWEAAFSPEAAAAVGEPTPAAVGAGVGNGNGAGAGNGNGNGNGHASLERLRDLSEPPQYLEHVRLLLDAPGVVGPALWDHLIYAYCIENTRLPHLVARAISLFHQGEELDVPSPETRLWMRTTEELFFRDLPSFRIGTLTSDLRPDSEASRRNAYYRMFGLDLNHGDPGGKPYPYHKARAANRDFVAMLEQLLLELWRGITNSRNTSGTNETDRAAIIKQAGKLRDMLSVRRRNGNLTREEFFYVSMMNWLHLSVEFNTPAVRDLKSEATSPDERIAKLAQRVRIPAHGRTENFVELGPLLSPFLIFVEAGELEDDAGLNDLLTAPTSEMRDDVIRIITHWSQATGRDIKQGRVSRVA